MFSHVTNDGVLDSFYQSSAAPQYLTQTVITESIRLEHPGKFLTSINQLSCDFLNYASAGHADATLDPSTSASTVLSRTYAPTTRPLENGHGTLAWRVSLGKFRFRWQGHDLILYIAEGARGALSVVPMNYLVADPSTTRQEDVDRLIAAASDFAWMPQDEVLVYDQSVFRKDKELYASAMKVSWDNVILSKKTKKAIARDVDQFFDGRELYESLGAPWKRGILYWGPPGNGKTLSIKAIMHSLYTRPKPVPTLYVKSFTSYNGPQFAIRQIFEKARSLAPCMLIMEDIDTLVTASVRSYFFNEVDGLESNSGILMVGTTNHMEWLDPGLSKRPSRFDRKYLFPLPDFSARFKYCEYWRHRLSKNKSITFPEKLSAAIAKITWDFSFAYIQEAFVAALLIIAGGGDDDDSDDDDGGDGKSYPQFEAKSRWDEANTEDDHSNDPIDDPELEKLVLWREVRRQVKSLREEMGDEQMPKMPERPDAPDWPNGSERPYGPDVLDHPSPLQEGWNEDTGALRQTMSSGELTFSRIGLILEEEEAQTVMKAAQIARGYSKLRAQAHLANAWTGNVLS